MNGSLGEPFESQQGVKQGCPLSTELFGIFIEGSADLIDANDSTFRPHRVHLRESPTIGEERVLLLC